MKTAIQKCPKPTKPNDINTHVDFGQSEFIHDAVDEVVFDPRVGRWRYRDSRAFAPMEAVRNLTTRQIDKRQREMLQVGRNIVDGTIGIRDGSIKLSELVKSIHLAGMVTALDSQNDIKPNLFLQVGRELKRQYRHGKDWETDKPYGLKWLMEEWGRGEMTERQFAHRLRLYGDSWKTTYWQTKRTIKRNRGATMARRILNPAEHCQECISYAGGGWIGISQIILPTQRCSCRVNCKCTVEFR